MENKKSQPIKSSQDVVVELLQRAGVPLTRENYLNMAYFGEVPEEWSAELEVELPQVIRKSLS
jgi:hypothetical protein